MRYKNLKESDLAILREKQAVQCETWAKNETIHPTVTTYYEAFTKGAKAALLLPHMPFTDAARAVATIMSACDNNGKSDKDWTERAWKAFWYGDVPDLETAIASTKKIEPEPVTEAINPDKL